MQIANDSAVSFHYTLRDADGFIIEESRGGDPIFYMHGHGVVQGLRVDLELKLDRYEARISAGYGLTSQGQGVHLPVDLSFHVEDQASDGDYVLWLVREDRLDPETARPVFDVSDRKVASRVIETLVPRLLQLVGLIAVLRFSVNRLTRRSDRTVILEDWQRRWDAFRGS